MFNLRNFLLASLVGGLILVEVFTRGVFDMPAAESQHKLTPQEQNAILSILQNGLGQKTAAPTNTAAFPNFSIPNNPAEVAGDALRSYGLITGTTAPIRYDQSYYLPAASTGALLQDIVPPVGSELFYAYQDGGRFWYGKNENVLVIFPDESIRGFNKRTGASSTWLQDKLAIAPITDPKAFVNYQTNYRAQIVAETSGWVLMEFPSGGVLKVTKPQAQQIQPAVPPTTENTASSVYGLPSVLPGYEATPATTG